MRETKDTIAPNIQLNCLDGRPAPSVVIQGWDALSAFPETALSSFWISMAPVLINPAHAANKDLVALFCKEHDITPDKMIAAMGCCELLLKQAAALDLAEDAFKADLEALSDGRADHLVRFILECWPDARKTLRQQIFMETLAAHGKVMTGLEWRMDQIRHSSKGNRLDADIVLLTLQYREGQRQNQITLQLPRDAAGKLADFCGRLKQKT